MTRRFLLLLLVVLSLVASMGVVIGSASSSLANAAETCVFEPTVDLKLDVTQDGRVALGPDRAYIWDQIPSDGGIGELNTLMYSLDGKYMGTIGGFVPWWVDSRGGLWGQGPSGPEWRSANGVTVKALADTTYYVHEFGDYFWAYVQISYPVIEARFDVYDNTGTQVATVPASPSSFKLEHSGGRDGFFAAASEYAGTVAVRQRTGTHDWVTLYEPDGTRIVELPPPPGATEYNTQGHLISANEVLVLDPVYTGSTTLYRYSLMGDYLGTIEIEGGTFAAEVFGELPDAGPPGVVIDGIAYWTVYESSTNVVKSYEIYRIGGGSAARVTGLSGEFIEAVYGVGPHLQVIQQSGVNSLYNSIKAIDVRSGSLLNQSETFKPTGVYVSGDLALVTSEGTEILNQIVEVNGTIRGVIEHGFARWSVDFVGDTVVVTDAPTYAAKGGLELKMYDVSTCSPPGGGYDGVFSDDDGSVFEADIEWMAVEGITKGCNPPTNDRFCPDGVVTRGQMAAFLVRALGLTDRLDDPFVDDDSSIFEADIERLAAAGITRGCNPPANDRFCPDGKVTREQMAAFLVRALHYSDDGGGDLFVDDDASIFEADIDRLAAAGVTKGCNPPTNDRFCPSGYVTRGQMAAFLHRALG